VTKQPFKSHTLYPAVHVKSTIEHLVESGIVERELADAWKERMKAKKRSEEELKETKEDAENGDAHAMYNLGIMYEEGMSGLKKDNKKAYKWFQKAADAGSVMGRALVGEYLLSGLGCVKKDRTEGLIMLSAAATEGSNYACYFLGLMYFKGSYGSKVNYARAKKWFEKAVADGAGSCEHKHLADESVKRARGLIAECNAFLEN